MHSKLEETTFHPAQGGIAERARDAFNLWRNAFQVPPFLECAITALDHSSSAQAGPITGPYCLPQVEYASASLPTPHEHTLPGPFR